MMNKKNEAPKPVTAVETKAPETKAVEVKAPVAEVKVVEVKTPETEKKEVAPKKAAPIKKEAAPKKAIEKKEPKTSVFIEYAGKQVVAKDVLKDARKAYEKMNKGVDIKTIEVYIKPEESAAYYVVNGKGSADYKIVLK